MSGWISPRIRTAGKRWDDRRETRNWDEHGVARYAVVTGRVLRPSAQRLRQKLFASYSDLRNKKLMLNNA